MVASAAQRFKRNTASDNELLANILECARERYWSLPQAERPSPSDHRSYTGLFPAQDQMTLAVNGYWPLPPDMHAVVFWGIDHEDEAAMTLRIIASGNHWAAWLKAHHEGRDKRYLDALHDLGYHWLAQRRDYSSHQNAARQRWLTRKKQAAEALAKIDSEETFVSLFLQAAKKYPATLKRLQWAILKSQQEDIA